MSVDDDEDEDDDAVIECDVQQKQPVYNNKLKHQPANSKVQISHLDSFFTFFILMLFKKRNYYFVHKQNFTDFNDLGYFYLVIVYITFNF